VRFSSFARIAPLVLAGLSGCSLELPGSGTEWLEDARAADGGDELDAAPRQDADIEDAGLDADALDATLDAGEGSLDDGGTDAEPPRCGSAALGAVEQRVRYAEAQVVAPAGCASETQERSCGAGGWSAWSGSYASETCEVATYRSCGAIAHGTQELRVRYVTNLATSSAGCLSQQQARTCDDGSFGAWSGSYQFATCAVDLLGTCALDSQVRCREGTVCSAARGQPVKCLGTPGYECSDNEQCVATCIDGECAVKAGPGAACEEAGDCSGCSAGSAVDCLDGACRCSDGAQCSANEQCKETCVDATCAPANQLCDDDADCHDGRECLRKAGEDACLLPDGSDCEQNADCARVCRASTCSAPGSVGGTCDENADCMAMLVCRAQFCASRATLGGTCDENADCAMGLGCGTTITGQEACLKIAGQACTLPTECLSGHCSSSGSGSGSTCQN
jgi:hypothetical protein